jgi:hypothetical protein
MATKKAQIIIEIDDKSLTQLNAEIKLLEQGMKDLKIGTEAWQKQNEKLGTLKNRFREATDEAKRLQGQVQKISSAEQIRAVAKLGAGMVGAFSAVSGTLTALGATGGKTMEAITAKGVQLMQIFGGLNQVAELFSTGTLKGLASLGTGFKSLTTTVRSFSTATKAALVATGIGALLVALGLVIANWDKIKSAIGGAAAAEEKVNKSRIESTEKIIKGLEAQNTAYENRKKILDELNKYDLRGGVRQLSEKDINEDFKIGNDLIQSRIDLIKSQLTADENARKTKLEKLDKDIKKAEDKLAYSKQEQSLTAQPQLWDNTIKKQEESVKVAYDAYNAQVSLNNAKLDEIQALEQQLYLNENVLKLREAHFENSRKQYIIDKEATDVLERTIIEKSAELDAENDIYKAKREILVIEKTQLENIPKKTKEEYSTLFALGSQIKALDRQNELYNYQTRKAKEKYELELKNLKLQQDYDVALSNIKLRYTLINEENKKEADYVANTIDLIGQEIQNLKDKEAFEISSIEFYKKLNTVRKTTVEDIVNNLQVERDYYVQIEQLTQDKLLAEKESYEIQIKKNDEKKAELEETAALLRTQLSVNEASLASTKKQLSGIKSDRNLSVADKQSKTLELQGKINDLELESKNITQKILDTNNEISDATNDTEKSKIKIKGINDQIVKSENKILEKTTQTTDQIKEQEKTYARLQNLLKEYGAEIDAVIRVLGQSMELVASAFDRRAANIQDDINRLNVEYDNMMRKQEDKESELDDLRAELADANGERYDEIQARITELSTTETAAFETEKEHQNEIAKLEHDKLVAERKAALWRKAQAIIEAVINGAMAVVKALPNVFLAVAVGVLSAAAIATIAVQKVPEVPPLQKYEKGGFTKKGRKNEVAGVVHAGEYVVPANVVESPSSRAHIAALESKRMKGYAEGGAVTPNVSSYQESFNYEKFAQVLSESIMKLPNPQVGLVNISNGLRDVELTKSNAGLTR